MRVDAIKTAVVTGSFDNLRSRDVRFLEEAARLGPLHVQIGSDRSIEKTTGHLPKFPAVERQYFLENIRYVSSVSIVDDISTAPSGEAILVCRENDLSLADAVIIAESQLGGFPVVESSTTPTQGRKKVLVTGCYDWLHSGHVRFFEEVSTYGDVYAVVGHDANILLLKGEGHPQFSQDERRYMVAALRPVKQCVVSTGHGWLDAEPELRSIKPDIYAVNEDGDKPAKRAFCEENGIEYLVLKRLPKAGLPRRESTALRGF